MSLKRSEGWNIPASHPFYPQLPAVYRNVKMQFLFFHASPEAVGAMLPEPLQPSEQGLCVAGGIDVPFCTSYGAFQESLLLMKCRFRDQDGYYCSHVFHNGPTGIAAGREIYGTPKVYAEVSVRQLERTLRTDTRIAGAHVLTIHSTADRVVEPHFIPSLVPAWRLKVIPKADGPGPAIKQLIDCSDVTRNMTIHFAAQGKGHLQFGQSPGFDLTSLAPVAYGEAFYMECSYAEGYARILYDYLVAHADGAATDPAN
jgi:acetoacetate decarboxylase